MALLNGVKDEESALLFELTEDQRMLSEMVGRLSVDQHSLEARRAAMRSDEGWLPDFWSHLSALGVLAAALPADVGGLDGGPIMTMLIQRAFGRQLVLSPFASTMAAAMLIARCGGEAQRETILPAILAGECRIALAVSERNDASLDHIATIARGGNAAGYRLIGRKPLIVGAPWCTHVVVAARVADEDALAAFLVPWESLAPSARVFQTIDGGRAADLRIDLAVPTTARIAAERDIAADLERMSDEMAMALCADACGSAEALLDATVAYAKTRRQFGQAIGRFQVLQHRMVDMMMERDQSIVVTHRAALSLDDDRIERKRAVSAAKAHVGRAGRRLAQAAVQIHGGIGITDELDVSHHFRRIEMLDMQYGSAKSHMRRYADLLDEAPARLRA
uniref:Butyryl-CoA dehydrogenase n=1 Tax=Sphingomonas sp. JE1 TaxID=1628059 RepID=A0A0D4ZZ81_9SPHN|nr:acyl-CoA dehydrogenase family protein [Sphingomonas sp. JE1]AJW29552.1 Butyryl-CoA dehydrogenase [Sphingomonas sp. JE1]